MGTFKFCYTRYESDAYLPLIGLDCNKAVTGEKLVGDNLVSVTETGNRLSPPGGHCDKATEDPDEPGNPLERLEVGQIDITVSCVLAIFKLDLSRTIFDGETKKLDHYGDLAVFSTYKNVLMFFTELNFSFRSESVTINNKADIKDRMVC